MDTNSYQVRTMINQKNNDDFLQKWETNMNKYQKWYYSKFKIFLKKVGNFIPIIIGYSFMTWIFMGVYDSLGFEKTLIILLVGVFWYGLRQKV